MSLENESSRLEDLKVTKQPLLELQVELYEVQSSPVLMSVIPGTDTPELSVHQIPSHTFPWVHLHGRAVTPHVVAQGRIKLLEDPSRYH